MPRMAPLPLDSAGSLVRRSVAPNLRAGWSLVQLRFLQVREGGNGKLCPRSPMHVGPRPSVISQEAHTLPLEFGTWAAQ